MNLFGTVGLHRPCDLVFVNGVCTVQDGAVCGLDEERIRTEATAEVSRLLGAQ